jgi:hypothetical protein
MASLRSDFFVLETSVVHGSETVNSAPPAAPALVELDSAFVPVVLDAPTVRVTVVGPPQPAATMHTNAISIVFRPLADMVDLSARMDANPAEGRSGRSLDATCAAPATNRVFPYESRSWCQ